MIVKLKWLRGFTSVDLSSNKIDDACAPALRSLMALKQLRRLDLRANDFGPSAGAAVLESLTRCRSLQVLLLKSVHGGVATIDVLNQTLIERPCYFHHNNFSP